MENASKNPLSGFFRQPALYVKLPSKGRWWADNALDLPATGEIPVFPMSTKDEISLKTPDALMNGQGIINVIQSCCPNIINAWEMPSVDVDTVLISIRMASFGNNMEFDSFCPHCKEENTHEIDLTIPLNSIVVPDYKEPILAGQLKIKLKPQRYFDINKGSSAIFDEERITQALNLDTKMSDEDRANVLRESMDRLVNLGINSVANSTDYIETDDGRRVTDPNFINEFYQNVPGELVRTVRDRLTEISKSANLKQLDLQCNECKKAYAVDLTFDYSGFFGKSS